MQRSGLIFVCGLSIVALMSAACPSGKPDAKKEVAKAASGPSGAPSGATAPSGPPDIPAPPDVAAVPADAEKTPTNLASKVLQKGTGTNHPEEQDTVQVNYTGWTTDGKMFDNSIQRGQPAEFPLNQVIAGWTEGVQLMTVGEKTRFWIPEALAYKGAPGAPAGMLVFDIELLEIMPPAPAQPMMNPHGAGGMNPHGAGGANPHGATPPPQGTPPPH
jgi:peptidylprolyl isomerase